MQGLRIRTKIFVGMIVVLLVFIGAAVLVINRWVGQVAERQVANTLQRGAHAYERFAALHADILASQARSMAQTPLLKAVMNIPEVDSETAYYTARELYDVADVQLMLLVDSNGALLVDAAVPESIGVDLGTLPGTADGLRGVDYNGVWRYGDHLYRIALTPIIIEQQILGLLVLGDLLDEAAAAEIRESIGKEVLFLHGGEVMAQSWERPPSSPLNRAEIAVLVDSITDAADGFRPVHILLDGTECLAVAIALGDMIPGHAVLFRRLDELEREADVLRISIVGMGGLAAIIAVLFSLWLSARLSRPIRALSTAAEQVGAGRFEERAQVYADDELGRLAQSFNVMVERVAERTRALQQEVNERRRTEEERASLEEQLRQSQKLEAVGMLAGGIAHDFNNLLMVISGYSEWLLGEMEEDNSHYPAVEQIFRAGDRGADLVRQLLAFSRRQILRPRVLDLNRSLGDMEKMLQRLISESVELVTAYSQDAGSVYADPGQIEQVVMNLVLNARDAMAEGGTLTIETAIVELGAQDPQRPQEMRPGEYVALAVSDTGEGMDAETQRRIFEPFFTTKGVDRGTGLGLSTVYGIIAQSGGHIQVESEPGRGTRFEIYLPRIEAAEWTDEEGEIEGELRGSETVLLVEDEEMVRNLVRLVLRQNGYRVMEAGNGAEALRLSEEHAGAIDFMVADVVMPQMSGPELARRLAPQRPQMKVLYISGYTDEEVFQREGVNEAVELLQKPFAPERLVRKVRELLDS